jgi:5-methylcytosine-specific restriction endonuclease McrA
MGTIKCPQCGINNVATSDYKQEFYYGTVKKVKLTAQVPLRSCISCGFQYFDDKAEQIREAVVNDFLSDTKHKNVHQRKLDDNKISTYWGRKTKHINSQVNRRYRGKKKGTIQGIELYWIVNSKCNNKCRYCGKQLSRRTMTFDHVIPLSRGGMHEVSNLVICCYQCNIDKGSLTLTEFLKERKDANK